VETIDYREEGTYISARVPEALANRMAQYSISGDNAINQLNCNSDEQQVVPDSTNEGDEEIDWVAIGRGRHSVTKCT